jgi:hypothetical protein
MSGVQGKPFRVIFLAATILTLLATSSLSADIKTLRKQAEAGDAKAQFNLGVAYFRGQGVPQDYKETVKWFRKAADQGLAEAQHNLGVAYAEGKVVPQKYTEAIKWYRKAAEQGFVDSQGNLGVAYFRGQGVPRDVVKSYMWLSLAASRSAGEDHENYSRARDLAAKKLTSEKLMEAQRMTREWEKSHPKK